MKAPGRFRIVGGIVLGIATNSAVEPYGPTDAVWWVGLVLAGFSYMVALQGLDVFATYCKEDKRNEDPG